MLFPPLSSSFIPLLSSSIHKLAAWNTSRCKQPYRWDLKPRRRSEPDLRERESGKRRNTKGRSWERASGIEQPATFHHQKSNKQLFRKKRSPEPCRFVSEGEKPAVRSNRPLIFLSCIKGTTLGRIRWWTSSSYIHCLSYALCQCIHVPPWNQSQNILCRLLFRIANGYKTLVLWLYCVCLYLSEEFTASYFFDKASLAVINLQKQQPVVRHNATKATFFCLCVAWTSGLDWCFIWAKCIKSLYTDEEEWLQSYFNILWAQVLNGMKLMGTEETKRCAIK